MAAHAAAFLGDAAGTPAPMTRTLRWILAALFAVTTFTLAASAQEVQAPAGASGAAPAPTQAGVLTPATPSHAPATAHTKVSPHPLWVLPFVLLLLSIALFPLLAPRFWEHQYPIVAGTLFAMGFAYYAFVRRDLHPWLHEMQEYVGFIALLFALYTVSGGLAIHISRMATPAANTLLLLLGAVLANLFGTTGASMLLIRPFLRMNQGHIRPYHVVFFIFIVGNVGGSLTPVGDPPLFLGYLKGVPFWWVIEHCWQPWLVATGTLATIFFIWDKLDHAKADRHDWGAHDAGPAVRINGIANFLLILVVVAAVFRPSVFEGIERIRDGEASAGALADLVFCREFIMLATALVSLRITKPGVYELNEFKFAPIKEVAILFIAIFSTMTPALEYLDANAAETLPLHTPGQFYFATGALSSVLDNAPTYLTFLQARLSEVPQEHVAAAHMAIADAYAAHRVQPDLPLVSMIPRDLQPTEVRLAVTEVLLEHEAHVIHGEGRIADDELKLAFLTGVPGLNDFLVAISIGSVFFGAMTYIGNAPNFMIKSVAEHAGVKMPSFLGYVVRYALPILLPVLVLVWAIFFLTG